MEAPDGYAFREAEPEDWAAIATMLGRRAREGDELRRRVTREHAVALAWVATRQDEARQDQAGESPGGETAQARDGDGGPPVAGAVVAGIPRTGSSGEQSSEARLLWIGVAPEHRRKGVGSRLLSLALDELRLRRAERVALLVDETQAEAQAFFEAHGFGVDSRDLDLELPAEAVAATGPRAGSEHADVRPLTLDDVPLLAGLLIHLGVERAEAPHDALEALTPAQVESWLQRAGTAACAAWEVGDPQSPVGLVWATRRSGDSVLRFVGVHDDYRRRGIGRALLAAVLRELERMRPAAPGGQAAAPAGGPRPMLAQLREPGPEEAFFRAVGFRVTAVTSRMSRPL